MAQLVEKRFNRILRTSAWRLARTATRSGLQRCGAPWIGKDNFVRLGTPDRLFLAHTRPNSGMDPNRPNRPNRQATPDAYGSQARRPFQRLPQALAIGAGQGCLQVLDARDRRVTGLAGADVGDCRP